jgi:hypothetical protein
MQKAVQREHHTPEGRGQRIHKESHFHVEGPQPVKLVYCIDGGIGICSCSVIVGGERPTC